MWLPCQWHLVVRYIVVGNRHPHIIIVIVFIANRFSVLLRMRFAVLFKRNWRTFDLWLNMVKYTIDNTEGSWWFDSGKRVECLWTRKRCIYKYDRCSIKRDWRTRVIHQPSWHPNTFVCCCILSDRCLHDENSKLGGFVAWESNIKDERSRLVPPSIFSAIFHAIHYWESWEMNDDTWRIHYKRKKLDA